MLTIAVPPELDEPLAEEAPRRGTTPELLALDGVRRMIPPGDLPPSPPQKGGSLLDFLGEHVGSVEGHGEPIPWIDKHRLMEGFGEKRPPRP